MTTSYWEQFQKTAVQNLSHIYKDTCEEAEVLTKTELFHKCFQNILTVFVETLQATEQFSEKYVFTYGKPSVKTDKSM